MAGELSERRRLLEKRERLADERDRAADERDAIADVRDRMADERTARVLRPGHHRRAEALVADTGPPVDPRGADDEVPTEAMDEARVERILAAADARDLAADRRDLAARKRDQAADLRERLDANGFDSASAHERAQAEMDRDWAARDRDHSAGDRADLVEARRRAFARSASTRRVERPRPVMPDDGQRQRAANDDAMAHDDTETDPQVG